MSGSQALAWLTCLLLAFLACVLGAYNLGRQRLVERDVEKVKLELAGSGAAPRAAAGEDLERIRASVALIRAEVEELKALQAPAAQEGLPDDVRAQMRARVERLQALVAALEEALQAPAPPPAPARPD